MPQLHITRRKDRPLDLNHIIRVRNEVNVKPFGGFWTSTFRPSGEYASDWIEWAATEMPEWIEGRAYILNVSPRARIYTIDGIADVRELHRRYPYEPKGFSTLGSFALIDWEKVSQDYDGVHLTEAGQWATRLTMEPHTSLYGWDSESTLWFRNVFTNVKPYEGKLVRGSR